MGGYSRDTRLIFLSVLLWGLGTAPFKFLQPLYVASLGATPQQIGQALGIAGTIGVILYIPVAKYSDRWGRKRVFLVGWGVGALATLGIAMAPDWRWFIPAMSIYSLSIVAMPAFYAYVGDMNREVDPNRLFAAISVAANLGAVISPITSGWIADNASLRVVYFVSSGLFLASTATLFFVSDQPKDEVNAPPKLTLITKDRPFMRQIALIFLLFFAIDVGQVMIPNLLHDVHGVTLTQIGQLGTIGTIGVLLMTYSFGRRPAERRDALLLTQFVALLALMLWLSAPMMIGFVIAYFLHGTNRLGVPFVTGRLRFFLPSRLQSLGLGFRETAMRLSFAVGPLVAGWLYGLDPYWPIFFSIVALIGTIGLTLILPSKRPSTQTIPSN